MRRWTESRIGVASGAALLAFLAGTLPAGAQDVEMADATITLSASGRAELWFQLENGAEHRVRFQDETIELDEVSIGSFGDNGELASAWRSFLREHAGEDGAGVRLGLLDFRQRLNGWAVWETADGDAARTLGDRLDAIFGLAPEAPATETTEGQAGLHMESTAGRPQLMQIVPGGLGFDVTGELDRLRSALHRLGDAGEAIDDRLAMIVHGDYQIPAESAIPGDVAILDGTLRLAGEVEGDILLLDGQLLLDGGARVQGNVIQVGGDLDFRSESAVVGGEILSDIALNPPEPVAPAAAESPAGPAADAVSAPTRARSRQRGPWSRFARNLGNAAEGLISATATFIGLAVLGLLLVYFARGRLETVSDTVRREFARSFAMGLAGQILFLPALLVLLVLVITWPIVPFFVLTAGLAALVGYIAVAHGAGEMFARRRYRNEWLEGLRRSNSYYYVISGLVLLMLPFAAGALLWVFGGAANLVRGLVLFVACVGTWVLGTVGFGGVLLTRAGGRSVVVDWSGAGDPREAAMHSGGEPMPEPDDPAPGAAAESPGDPADDA